MTGLTGAYADRPCVFAAFARGKCSGGGGGQRLLQISVLSTWYLVGVKPVEAIDMAVAELAGEIVVKSK